MRLSCVLWALLACASGGVRERGAELEATGRWDDAARLYRIALGEVASDEGMRLWLLTSLIEIEFNRHDYDAAERWLHEAEQICVQEDSREGLRLRTARGTLHLVRGNLTAAGRELPRAIAIGASRGFEEDLAAALHNMAAVEMHTNHLDEALEHERQALAIWIDRLGDRHDYVLKAWISLSSLQGLRGDWSGAESSLRRALAIRVCDEALANYAVVLEHLKRGKEAKRLRARLRKSATYPPAVVDVRSAAQPIRTE